MNKKHKKKGKSDWTPHRTSHQHRTSHLQRTSYEVLCRVLLHVVLAPGPVNTLLNSLP